MAKGLIEASVLTGIADAIREKDGTTAKMLASAMEGKIRNISPKVKTGTFTPTNESLSSKNITVSNVGFSPKHVVIYANPNSNTNVSGASSHGVLFLQNGFSSNFTLGYGEEDTIKLRISGAGSSYEPTLNLTANGFTLTRGYVFKVQYRYIAIG